MRSAVPEINGSHVERNWIRVGTGTCGIAADAKHVYWLTNGGEIGRADVSGANVDAKFIKTSLRALGAVAVTGSHIFWTDHEGIGRANIDGKDVKQDFLPANIATSLAADGRYSVLEQPGDGLRRDDDRPREAGRDCRQPEVHRPDSCRPAPVWPRCS